MSSLAGIEYLTALKELYCMRNSLTELDLSNNPELVNLYCAFNNLTELDLSACPYLLEAVRSGSITEEERYIKYESANRALSVDPTMQLITGEESAYSVTVTDYTKGAAQTSLDLAGYYSGDVLFSVASKNDTPVLVAVKDGDEYTVLPCTTDENGAYSYWLSVDRNIEIVLVFKGDADLNGSVTAADGNRVKRAAVGTYSFANELSRLAADVNSDGLIQTRDGHMIQRFAIGTYVISW